MTRRTDSRVIRGSAAALSLAVLSSCAEEPSAPASDPEIVFASEAAARGVLFEYRSGSSGRFFLPEIVGGGVAMIDVESDGDLDLYFVQGGSVIDNATRPANELYLNQGDGHFLFAGAERGLADTGYGMGVAVGDYDNDGDADLYVTNYGANRLFRNDGRGFFAEVGVSAGVADEGWGTGAAFVDFDNDGWLDLVHANYIVWRPQVERDCFVRGVRTYCPPQNYNAATVDTVYRNNRDGTFTDVTVQAGLAASRGNGFGVVTGDFNGDGMQDVFVANDMTVDHLWLNRGDFSFEEAGVALGVGVDSLGAPKAGMGVAVGDIDRDGDGDLLVVNIDGQSDSLFRNDGSYFSDVTAAYGLVAASRQFTRWGVAFADFNHDGWLDLFEANGRVDPGPSPTDDPWAEVNLLHAGDAGGLRRRPLDRSRVHSSRGMAAGDLDDDGRIDLVIVNRDAPAYILMNQTQGGSWVRFRVSVGGRAAIGAEVELVGELGGRVFRGRVQPDGSYLAASDPRVHFGLGESSRVASDAASDAAIDAAMVTWPDGVVTRFDGPFALATTHTLARERD